MAAVAGAFGVRSIAQAQDDDAEAIACEWAFKALIVDRSEQGRDVRGLMQVDIERDGAIDNATLETEDPEPFRVVGNTRGKAISLRITI